MNRLPLLVVTLLVFATPRSSADSASDDMSNIRIYRKILNQLPNHSSPYAPTRAIIIKLVKLDPRVSAKYLKAAVKKFVFTPQIKSQAEMLQKHIVRLVRRTDLPKATIDRIVREVERALEPIPGKPGTP